MCKWLDPVWAPDRGIQTRLHISLFPQKKKKIKEKLKEYGLDEESQSQGLWQTM